MGGAACSSWYFLRFADPHNDQAFAAREKIDRWLPVDLYVGGAEHAVMHLLYARFWTKVLYDAGCIDFDEPFLRLRNQGQLLTLTPGRRPRSGESAEGSEEGERVIDWILLRPEERESFSADQVVTLADIPEKGLVTDQPGGKKALAAADLAKIVKQSQKPRVIKQAQKQ